MEILLKFKIIRNRTNINKISPTERSEAKLSKELYVKNDLFILRITHSLFKHT